MTPDKDEEFARLRAENARFAGLLDRGPHLFDLAVDAHASWCGVMNW